MEIVVDISQVQALAGTLHRRADAIEPEARRVVAKVAHDITATAQQIAPVDTGNLKNSISADVDGLEAVVGPTAEYGHYVEYGTSRMGPQPYMRPAVVRHTDRFETALARIGGRL